MRKVLIVAFHFPPVSASSGVHRVMSFVRGLPAFGWEPVVLTVNPSAHEARNSDHFTSLPESLVVERALAMDTARHLSFRGRYPLRLATPDRWVSWYLSGVAAGIGLVRRERPSAILSTYPIATAHKIAATLARLSRLPWIADFRDPMAQDGYPPERTVWKSFLRIERRAILECARATFVAPSAVAMYAERYPEMAFKFALLENGYDEAAFAAAEETVCAGDALNPHVFTLLHSGIVYPSERDPEPFFAALRLPLHAGRIDTKALKVRFRACMHHAHVMALAKKHAVDPLIEVFPPSPYKEALSEMLRADGLLLLQAANCNQQVPAKLYEYIRARRPTLGLTDAAGDTAAVMRRAGFSHIAPLDSPELIASALMRFLSDIKAGTAPLPSRTAVDRFSRDSTVGSLAALLDGAVAQAPSASRFKSPSL